MDVLIFLMTSTITIRSKPGGRSLMWQGDVLWQWINGFTEVLFTWRQRFVISPRLVNGSSMSNHNQSAGWWRLKNGAPLSDIELMFLYVRSTYVQLQAKPRIDVHPVGNSSRIVPADKGLIN